jgi:transposase
LGVDKLSTPSYKTKNLDHLGLVAGFCKEVGIANLIDKALPEQSEQKHISYGQLLEAMILNGLGFTGRTLHMYSQYFQDKPLERLLGEGIEAKHINDDALGRCLDKLFEYGVSDIYQQLGEKVVQHLDLPCEAINLDTTSFHVDGDYEVDDDFKGIHLTRGYSRDHRPELNQVILSLITENQACIPVYMKAHSGNTNDAETFKKLVKSHISSLKSAEKCRYLIGDSALYVAETIKTLSEQNQFFITRVPQKIIEVKELLANLDTLSFSELNNGYRGALVESDYAGIKQKWLVVHSRQANKRELKTLEKRIDKSMTASQKSFKKLCAQTFSCRADASKAVEIWETKQDYAELDVSNIETIITHTGRGRPSLNTTGTTLYKITGSLKCSQERKQRAESMLGLFPPLLG